MNINEETYLAEVQKRVTFYGVLSHESPEVVMESFKVYKHPDTPKQHFIHLKYTLLDKEDDSIVVSTHEEIETFVRAREKAKRGWLCMLNQENPEQIKEFLKNAIRNYEINTNQVLIR